MIISGDGKGTPVYVSPRGGGGVVLSQGRSYVQLGAVECRQLAEILCDIESATTRK